MAVLRVTGIPFAQVQKVVKVASVAKQGRKVLKSTLPSWL
jgi:hypothetical protein